MDAKEKLTEAETQRLSGEFIKHLEVDRGRPRTKQFIVAVAGTEGSGKTTIAREFSELTGAVHVQSNSARQILRETGHMWGENVNRLVERVMRRLLADGYSIILDGMAVHQKERDVARELAKGFGAKIFFVALVTSPEVALRRAQERYAGRVKSTFEDWRASPEKLADYLERVQSQPKVFKEEISHEADDVEHGILRIHNDSVPEYAGIRVISNWITQKL